MSDNAQEILRLEFNEWARAGRGESMERGHQPTGLQAIQKMQMREDAQVLDVGCGSGWASRLLAQQARRGEVIGIDISDEMIRIATESSTEFANVSFQVGSAEHLQFDDCRFTHAFSMESLYYYDDMLVALREIHRVLAVGGLFVTVVDLYRENEPSHAWVEQLQVPVHLLSIAEYHSLFEEAGFAKFSDERILDPAPIVSNYTGTSFKSHADYVKYREAGSLMLSGTVER
jgi:ubiquinone/menaquinone biosynthesis C-methylase UbiE